MAAGVVFMNVVIDVDVAAVVVAVVVIIVAVVVVVAAVVCFRNLPNRFAVTH